jgi:UrcA family protein
MRRYVVLASLVAVSLAIPVTAMAAPEGITVEAPRIGKRDPATGAAIETVTHAVVVSLKGLDLATPAGLKAAETRITDAAAGACRWLDEHYAEGLSEDSRTCIKDATKRTMDQLNAALAQPK